MVLPGRLGAPRAVITFERGDMRPSLNMTCLLATREKDAVRAWQRWKRNGTYANGVCKSRLESDSLPPPSSSLSNWSMSTSSISGSEVLSCLPVGKLNFLATSGRGDKVCPKITEGALDLCGCLFNDGTLDLDCSLDDELDSSDDLLRLGFGVSDMMAKMSGLVRPRPASVAEPFSLLGNGCGRVEVVGGGDLNEEGGGGVAFDLLADCGGRGNWVEPWSSSMSEHR